MTMSAKMTAIAVAPWYIHLLDFNSVEDSSSFPSKVSLERSPLLFGVGTILSEFIAGVVLDAWVDSSEDESFDELLSDGTVNNGSDVVNTLK